MADTPKSPFLGLDKALIRSTKRSEAATQPETQISSKPETQNSTDQETKNSRNLDVRTVSVRSSYQKVAYRLSPDAINAVEDLKRLLRRQHGIKANLEEIVEEAILAMEKDYQENEETSILVRKFSRNLEDKKSR